MACKPGWFGTFICLYCTIYTIIFFFVLLSIVFWIVISPSSVKFHVTDATLTEFNLTNNNNTLYYNFKLNVTVRNPNNNIIVYYRRITAFAWYKDNNFGYIKLGRKQVDEYSEETRVGIYNDLAVDFDIKIRAKFGSFYKSGRFNTPVVQCRRLRVPLISANSSSSSTTFSFSERRCSSASFFTDRDANAGA
ncbi:unnamed protein product [Vicia faba]|uniref:Late embryogenesis abundant protein LEA-2 subgroup domain-containing protein n=1 Tax=Vicia faba TaxID=3906 RepID=A0AAV0ZB53_VICFA|nr:unnamed protein product [Vicia faba]